MRILVCLIKAIGWPLQAWLAWLAGLATVTAATYSGGYEGFVWSLAGALALAAAIVALARLA